MISLIFLIFSTYELKKTLYARPHNRAMWSSVDTALRFVEREHVHWNRALRHIKAHVIRRGLISRRETFGETFIREVVRFDSILFFLCLSPMKTRSASTIDSSTSDYSFKKSRFASNVDRLTRFAKQKREGMKGGEVFNVRSSVGWFSDRWSKFRGSVADADADFVERVSASGACKLLGCISFLELIFFFFFHRFIIE